MDVSKLLKDKKLLYGIGLAAVAGAAVFWQKSRSGSSTSNQSTTYAGTGTLDTTGTDIASTLSSYSSSMLAAQEEQNKLVQEQLSSYETSLTNALSGIGTMSSDTSTSDYRTISVPSGTWLTEVLRNNNLTLSDLVKYNPDINTRLSESSNAGWVTSSNPLPSDRLLSGERLSFYGDQIIKAPK
jgi:hypothetical protein